MRFRWPEKIAEKRCRNYRGKKQNYSGSRLNYTGSRFFYSGSRFAFFGGKMIRFCGRFAPEKHAKNCKKAVLPRESTKIRPYCQQEASNLCGHTCRHFERECGWWILRDSQRLEFNIWQNVVVVGASKIHGVKKGCRLDVLQPFYGVI